MECVMELEYGSREMAELVFNSTRPDDDDFVKTELDGNRVVVTIRAETIQSLRRAIDDFLSCAGLAEKAGLG